MSVPALTRSDCMGAVSPCMLRRERKRDCTGACALRAKDDFVEPKAPVQTLLDVTIPIKPAITVGLGLGLLAALLAAKKARR